MNSALILCAKKTNQTTSFYYNNLGKIQTALFEKENKNGFLFGITENYIKIKIPDSRDFLSGSPLYDNSNRLLGMVSFSDEKYIYYIGIEKFKKTEHIFFIALFY